MSSLSRPFPSWLLDFATTARGRKWCLLTPTLMSRTCIFSLARTSPWSASIPCRRISSQLSWSSCSPAEWPSPSLMSSSLWLWEKKRYSVSVNNIRLITEIWNKNAWQLFYVNLYVCVWCKYYFYHATLSIFSEEQRRPPLVLPFQIVRN